MYTDYNSAHNALQKLMEESKYGSRTDFNVKMIKASNGYFFDVSILGCTVLSALKELDVEFVDSSIDEFRSLVSFLSRSRKVNIINIDAEYTGHSVIYTVYLSSSNLSHTVTYKLEASHSFESVINILSGLNYDIIIEQLYA